MIAGPPAKPRGSRPTRHRVFLDANVLFSAAYRAESGLDRLWALSSSVTLLSSPYAIEEARRNLSDAAARERLDHLLTGFEIVADVAAGALPKEVDLPDKDRPILLAALAAGATHLLTGDRVHFGVYFGRRIGGLLVERPGDYLRRDMDDAAHVPNY